MHFLVPMEPRAHKVHKEIQEQLEDTRYTILVKAMAEELFFMYTMADNTA